MTTAIERRTSRRQLTVRNKAAVSFKSKGRSRIVGANLVDISPGGARLRMREMPPLNGLLSVRLLSPVPTPAVTATVVWVGDGGEIGVQFPLGCNRTLFWTSTRGEDFGSGRLPRRSVAMERVGPQPVGERLAGPPPPTRGDGRGDAGPDPVDSPRALPINIDGPRPSGESAGRRCRNREEARPSPGSLPGAGQGARLPAHPKVRRAWQAGPR